MRDYHKAEIAPNGFAFFENALENTQKKPKELNYADQDFIKKTHCIETIRFEESDISFIAYRQKIPKKNFFRDGMLNYNYLVEIKFKSSVQYYFIKNNMLLMEFIRGYQPIINIIQQEKILARIDSFEELELTTEKQFEAFEDQDEAPTIFVHNEHGEKVQAFPDPRAFPK
jgi:hypothetical protein